MHDVAEESIFWRKGLIVEMSEKEINLPLPDPTVSVGTSKVSNMFGGLNLQWKPTGSMPETEPSFRNVQLVANDLDGYILASNEVVQDGMGLGKFIHQLFVRSVGWFSDQAFFNGSGVGQPLGVVTAPGSILVSRNTSTSVVQVDLATMVSRLLPSSWPRAIWGISPGAILKIANLSGLGGLLAFLPGDDGSQGLLYGMPFYVTEKLPDLGTTGDVCLIDPYLYVIGYRALNIGFSDQEPTAFLKYQSVYRVKARIDGQPWLNKAITLASQASNTVSPKVILQ
jgi:HK97 family phage major capsid protein